MIESIHFNVVKQPDTNDLSYGFFLHLSYEDGDEHEQNYTDLAHTRGENVVTVVERSDEPRRKR
jgi:hypothetical protein